MGAFAFALLLVTALGGTMVLVEWYDGERPHAPSGTTAVVAVHVGLALASFAVMGVFLAIRGAGLATAMVAVVVLTALLGVTAITRSRRGRLRTARQGDVGIGFLAFHAAGALAVVVAAVVAAIIAH